MGYRDQTKCWYVVLEQQICQRSSGNNKLFLVHSNEPIISFTVQSSVLEVSHVNQFVGRSDELAAIHNNLQHDGSRKTVVVHGLGGMGKTQLALAYAQRQRDKY
jgi:hypothetical protein